MILYSPGSEKFFRMEVSRENVVDRTDTRGKSVKTRGSRKTIPLPV